LSSITWWSSHACRKERRGVKVAFDGEVAMLRAPLDFRVHADPLYLLAPPHGGTGA